MIRLEQTIKFPKRAIHLDFHTGPDVPDVGRHFDPETFAARFKDAHVDSVTLFGMCHHGHLYYDTGHPARHPSLPPDLNLLGEQIEALHRVGIMAPIYLSIQVNEFAANQHPEWIALNEELQHVKRGGAFEAGWQILDMSSPYADYFADILQQVLDQFTPVDGIFLDMCWDQPSCSPWALQAMGRQGYDPRRDDHRRQYARELAHSYMGRYRDMVEKAQRGHRPVGTWFNSRPKTNLHEERKFLRHVEIESLPTGGWGYAYFPYTARFVRPLQMPSLGMTGRFFKSWGDNASLKPAMALKYECCQILSQGMASSVGDLLHPRAEPSAAVYDLIGSVYAHIQDCEPYVDGGELLSEIAVLVDPELGDNPGPAGLGAVRALQQLRHQFDILPPSADLENYKVVVIPETTTLDANCKEALKRYVRQGGGLLVSGPAAFDREGRPILEEMGVRNEGPIPQDWFLRAEDSVRGTLADYGYVMYEPGWAVTAAASEAEVLVRLGRPYFQRSYDRFSGHSYTAEDGPAEYAAVIKNGRVITCSVPLLEAYGRHAAPNYRVLLGNILEQLLPEPLVRDAGPSLLETTVVKKDQNLVVHLLSFCPERRADGMDIVEDAIPLVNMPIAVRVHRKPSRVYLAPGEQELDFTFSGGYVHTQLTVLEGHTLLVLENSL